VHLSVPPVAEHLGHQQRIRPINGIGLVSGFPHILESSGFFPGFSRLWKVPENQFGPGNESLRFWKVLENEGSG